MTRGTAVPLPTIDLTFDAARPVELAEFWKLALGYVDEPPPAPYETREDWLRAYDVPEDEWEQGAWLCHPSGDGPRLGLLQVPEPKTAKNRLHLDVRLPPAASPEEGWAAVVAEVARLSAAGGTVLHEATGHHVVMADPEGNEFCVSQRAPTAGYAPDA